MSLYFSSLTVTPDSSGTVMPGMGVAGRNAWQEDSSSSTHPRIEPPTCDVLSVAQEEPVSCVEDLSFLPRIMNPLPASDRL